MKRIFYYIIILLTIINTAFAANDLTIDIDNKDSRKINVAFEKIDYLDKNGKNTSLVNKILNVVKNDLNTTGLFNVDEMENTVYDNNVKNLSNSDLNNLVVEKYINTNYEAVLSGYLENNKDGAIELKLRLWDILDQRELFGKYYIVNETNWKRVGDSIANNIYEFLTGETSGHFDSKIIFISETGKIKNRKKRIAMVDFDGSNLKYITDGKNLVLTPVFSKYDKNEIIYLEYKNDKAQLYKLNLQSNKLELISDIGEMTYAPNFNPNGTNEVVFSATKGGISNIYKMNFDDKKVKQLTFDRAISTVPSWSPDGERIIFVSDKTGVRKLYIMDKNGNNIEMITKNRGTYDKPSWSPDGKLISFVKLEGGEFSIGLITPDGESERTIMSAYLVEGIKWSPNGRYLIYSKQKGPFGKDSIPGIYTIDILTGIEYKIPTPKNQGASDPDWINK